MAKRKGISTGTSAQRTIEEAGHMRFNTTTNLLEYYDGSQWKAIDSPPVVSSIDVTEVDSQAGGNQTIVITGGNFASGATVTFVGNAGTDFSASTVTVDSVSQITAVAPKSSFLNAQEPYGVKVENASGLSATLASQINVDTSPSWSTASGTIATIQDNATGTHATVLATDADSDTIVYSETTSVLSGAGLTLNSSTGAITGDPTDVSSATTNTFTLRATANSKTVDRSFNIIVNPTPVDVYYLLIAGGGSGGNGYGAGGGGAGGLLTNWGGTALDMYKGVTYDVTVGDGGNTRPTGNNQGYDGEDSTFGGSSGVTAISTLTAIGGGGGGSGGNISSSVGRDGGSGGGGGWTQTYRQGYGTYSGSLAGGIYNSSPRQGYDGSLASVSNASDVGGGGGGAGQAGYFTGGQNGTETVQTAPGFGGNGLQINIDGNNYYWAGGGGGGSDYNGNAGTTQGGDGGLGGGGYGLHTHRSNGSYGGSAINGSAGGNDAGNNTGGGGGAGATGAGGSGVGGSGIFILRYPNTLTATVGTLASNTITVGSDKVTYITGQGTGTISIA